MKNILFLLAAIVTISGWNCGGSSTPAASVNGTLISGNIQNAANIQVFLDEWHFDNSASVIGKAEVASNGKFEIATEEPLKSGIYRMRIGAKKTYLVFDGTEKHVKISGDIAEMDKYKLAIDGSTSSQQMMSKMAELTQNNRIDKNQVKLFVESVSNPLTGSLMSMLFLQGDPAYLNTFKGLKDKIVKINPGTKYASDFTLFVSQVEQQMLARQASAATSTGAIAPDIDLPNPDGKNFKLSDLKGKVVLLDFWASWCGPCRKSNPHVVELYKKYKNQGFTVYSVSLDGIHPRRLPSYQGDQGKMDEQIAAAKKKWLAAIQKDNLGWDTHVSDLKHWNSPVAKQYGVSGIPATFLIDKEGKIALSKFNPLSPQINLEQEIKRLL